jgi:hypothetical protein
MPLLSSAQALRDSIALNEAAFQRGFNAGLSLAAIVVGLVLATLFVRFLVRGDADD